MLPIQFVNYHTDLARNELTSKRFVLFRITFCITFLHCFLESTAITPDLPSSMFLHFTSSHDSSDTPI